LSIAAMSKEMKKKVLNKKKENEQENLFSKEMMKQIQSI